MILGRYLGTIFGMLLILVFRTNTILDILLIFAFAIIGTVIGMIFSTMLGINTTTDQPTEKDGLKYWTNKYGEDYGKELYAEWLKSIK